MRKQMPDVTTLDQVTIRRENETAVITPKDPRVATVNLTIGPMVQRMSDEQILDLYNATIGAQQQGAAAYHHVAVEVPPGQPQIRYHETSNQWVPRGDVLRCLIDDGGPDGEATVTIDDRELSMTEFGRLLSTYAGWGMRVVFVPSEDTHKQPEITLREPDGG
jgi:hypothetical protein